MRFTFRIEVVMSMGTRYGRIHESLDAFRSTGGTQVVTNRMLHASRVPATVRSLFDDHQRVMSSAVAEERRPGLFVFAAHERLGLIGRLWLQASETPRAGTLGRHDLVDLPLPADDALSLRHLLFAVRLHGTGVRFCAVDLGTPGGMLLESGAEARLVEGSTALFLRASDFTLFCLPTGVGAAWDRRAVEPWSTLPDRTPLRVETPLPTPERGVAGNVELSWDQSTLRVNVSHRALKRGLLIGRMGRCDACVPVASLSRVHVVLLELQGEVFLFDSGSTNGTWVDGEEVFALALHTGAVVRLGEEVTLRWARAH